MTHLGPAASKLGATGRATSHADAQQAQRPSNIIFPIIDNPKRSKAHQPNECGHGTGAAQQGSATALPEFDLDRSTVQDSCFNVIRNTV